MCVYGRSLPDGCYDGQSGTVDSLNTITINIKLDHEVIRTFHPKQCRRLVKKGRRRIWVHKDRLAYDQIAPEHRLDRLSLPLISGSMSTIDKVDDYVEFVEVRKKK